MNTLSVYGTLQIQLSRSINKSCKLRAFAFGVFFANDLWHLFARDAPLQLLQETT
jgi:hypothetical protein